ncbi:unnamed protein product [Linum trigynum]|uniref:Transposase MuDR plant domain-containing protein n=1 Tax=Linum trigynum TaxID=586398 RepID=A0AAV2D5Y0_9ROSI
MSSRRPLFVENNEGERRHPYIEVSRPEIERDIEFDADSEFIDEENAVSEDEFNVDDAGSGGFNHNFPIDDIVVADADSDCGDSDYLGSVHSSDDEGNSRKRFEKFNPARDMEDPHFSDGQIFRDFKTFKEAIRAYPIKNKFPLRFVHSDTQRVQVLCDKNCRWNIWVSPTKDKKAVQIKSVELQHDGCVLLSRHKWFDYKFIAKKYLQRFEVDPKWGTDAIV